MTQKHEILAELKRIWGVDFKLVRIKKHWWTMEIDGTFYMWFTHQSQLINDLNEFKKDLPFLKFRDDGSIEHFIPTSENPNLYRHPNEV